MICRDGDTMLTGETQMFPFWIDLSATSLTQMFVVLVGIVMWFGMSIGPARG